FAADAGLPVRIARRVGHHRRPPRESDGNILTCGCRESVVAGETPVGCLKKLLLSLLPRCAPQGKDKRVDQCAHITSLPGDCRQTSPTAHRKPVGSSGQTYC